MTSISRTTFAAALVAALAWAPAARSADGPRKDTFSYRLVGHGSDAGTAMVGRPYLADPFVVGGLGKLNYAIDVGLLPPGLTLDADSGVVFGIPTEAGDYGAILKATDVAGETALTELAVSVTVAAGDPAKLAVTGLPPVDAAVGQPYFARFKGTGGTGKGYVFASVGAPLPPGLELSTDEGDAIVTGKPTAGDTYVDLQIGVTDSAGAKGKSDVFAVTVTP